MAQVLSSPGVKPQPWRVRPGRVAPEGRWAWEGLDSSLAWLWNPQTDRFRSITGRELVYNGGDVGATSPETGKFGRGYKLPGGDDHNGIGFQEVLPTLADAFTVLMFFRFDGSFRVGESGVWDAGAAAGQTNGPFGVFKFGGDIDFTISDGATAEALDGPDVTLSAGDHVALVATCSLGAGVHALYQETNGDFASASRTPGISSFAAFPSTASNHRIGAWDDGKFRPLEGLIYLAVLIPEVWWTEGQARQWMRDPFAPFRPARRTVVFVDLGGAQTISAPVAAATVSAPTPSVSPGPATLSPPVASALAEALPPQVAAAIGLSLPVAEAQAEAQAPTPSTLVAVNVPVADAQAEATAPAVSTASDQTVSAPVAEVQAEAVAPSVSTTVTLNVPIGVASADATAPSVVQGTVVSAPVASVQAEASAPGVSPGPSALALVAAEAVAEAPAPATTGQVSVEAPVAQADADALSPAVQAVVSLALDSLQAVATAQAPSVSPGASTVPLTVAVVTVEALPPNVVAGTLFVNRVTGEVFITRTVSGDAMVAQRVTGDVKLAEIISGDVEV